MLIQFQNSIRYAVTLNSGTFSEHNRELLIAVKRFELSVHVHVQLLFFYWTVFKRRNNQDDEN